MSGKYHFILLIATLLLNGSCHNIADKKQKGTSAQDSIATAKSKRLSYLAKQNNVGDPANDFNYITPDGVHKKMYNLKASYTLLFFYNPECQACKDMKAVLMASPKITENIGSGNLKLLSMYIDSDTLLWRKHLPELPASWIAGRDENEYLYRNNIYDLRAIPTVYLLDKDKKVLLKDCLEPQQIEQYL